MNYYSKLELYLVLVLWQYCVDMLSFPNAWPSNLGTSSNFVTPIHLCITEAFDTSNTKNNGLELLEPDVEDGEDFDDDAESGSEEEDEDDDFDEEADDDVAEDDDESDIGEEEAGNVGKTDGKLSTENVSKKLDTGIFDETSKEHSIMVFFSGRILLKYRSMTITRNCTRCQNKKYNFPGFPMTSPLVIIEFLICKALLLSLY